MFIITLLKNKGKDPDWMSIDRVVKENVAIHTIEIYLQRRKKRREGGRGGKKGREERRKKERK